MAGKRRNPEIIAGRVNADGSVATAAGDFTAQRTAVGQYSITFPTGFRLVSITGSPAVSGDQRWVTFFNPTDRGTQLYVMDSGGVATDRAFSFIAAGVQT